MADEVKKDKAKPAKPGFFARMSRSFRDTRGEMKKVVWPTKKQTTHNTVVVLAFMLVMAVIIGLFDAGLTALVRQLVGS